MFQRHPIQNEHMMFITTNMQDRKKVFANPAHARMAVETLYSIQDFYAFFLYAFVIMPDHIHLLLKIPEGGSVSKTMLAYKRAVSFNIGQRPIWQSRFHIKIVDGRSTAIKRYIHMNPVKAGLCAFSYEYPWSSACGRWDIQELDCW